MTHELHCFNPSDYLTFEEASQDGATETIDGITSLTPYEPKSIQAMLEAQSMVNSKVGFDGIEMGLMDEDGQFTSLADIIESHKAKQTQ